MLDIEAQRMGIQEGLDAAKTAAERNWLGQFATPPNLTLDIACYAQGLWRNRAEAASFLDPAIGTGSFYSALRRTFPPQAVADACGVEMDPPFAAAAKRLWEGSGLRIMPDDFTGLSPDQQSLSKQERRKRTIHCAGEEKTLTISRPFAETSVDTRPQTALESCPHGAY